MDKGRKHDEARDFLHKFKEAMDSGGLELIPTEDNRRLLVEMGLTLKNAEDEILSLTPVDYCDGPLADRDGTRRGRLWVFGKEIEGKEVYVKLKLEYAGGEKKARCISFHVAKRRLGFPLG